jgi:hypothetical protein
VETIVTDNFDIYADSRLSGAQMARFAIEAGTFLPQAGPALANAARIFCTEVGFDLLANQ